MAISPASPPAALQTPQLPLGQVFGFRLPFVPDFLLDHTLLGERADERIEEHLSRWVQFLASLWRPQGDALYQLRFNFDPAQGEIGVFFLVRLNGNPAQGLGTVIQALIPFIKIGLETLGFEPQQLTLTEIAGLTIPNARVFSITQAEEYVPVRRQLLSGTPMSPAAMHGAGFHKPQLPQECLQLPAPSNEFDHIYNVSSWWGPSGSFLMPFSVFKAQKNRVCVCAFLQPVQLDPFEKHLIGTIAREAESLAQLQTDPDLSGYEASQNRTDPQLRFISRLYAANLRRLAQPFWTTIICSADTDAAGWQIANAIATSLREETSSLPPWGETQPLPSGATVKPIAAAFLGDVIDLCHLRRDLYTSSYAIDTVAPHKALSGLRFLCDARGAASAFRFPTSVRGGIPGVRVKQRPPDFHPGPASAQLAAGEIEIGHFYAGGLARLRLRELTKHTLVTGFTGSGKTTTVLNLLHQLWCQAPLPGAKQPSRGPHGGGIPFLVIESAKHEYRGLQNVPAFAGLGPDGKPLLRIYTLGNESIAPFRLNPFELLPGVRLEAHLGRLQTCFEGALPSEGPLPSLVSEALQLIYEDLGWDIMTDSGPPLSARLPHPFPVMSDLFKKLEALIGPRTDECPTARGYVGEVLANITAFAQGRLRPLLMGSRGRMFDTQRSTPLHELFQTPVLLELNDLNENDKSLVMMFLLMFLREFREKHPSPTLCHVTVVEEAHNVLSNVQSQQGSENVSDTKYRAVQAFCNLLSEVRALGEGLIISDQSPEKLAPDAIRNTNLQIAHNLRAADDRDAVSNAMLMSDEQRDFLGTLEPGMAAVFYTGLQRATFVQVPRYSPSAPGDIALQRIPSIPFRGLGFAPSHGVPSLNDAAIAQHMQSLHPGPPAKVPFEGCRFCPCQCQFGKVVESTMSRADIQRAFAPAIQILEAKDRPKGVTATAFFRQLTQGTVFGTALLGQPKDADLGWCFALHAIEMEYQRRYPGWDSLHLVIEQRKFFDKEFERLTP